MYKSCTRSWYHETNLTLNIPVERQAVYGLQYTQSHGSYGMWLHHVQLCMRSSLFPMLALLFLELMFGEKEEKNRAKENFLSLPSFLPYSPPYFVFYCASIQERAKPAWR